MTDPLKGLANVKKTKGLPPVHLWNPPYCGEINMEIKRDGTWFYENTPIGRKELVRLFSTILWREDDDYFLVTPVEKVKIRVEDAPFVAIDFTENNGAIDFTTNTGDLCPAGPDHPIAVTFAADEEPAPYILVRRNLWALIDRKSYYRLVDIGKIDTIDGTRMFGLQSRGKFFPLDKADRLGL